MHCGADRPCCRPLQCLRFAPNFSVELMIHVTEIECYAQKTMLRGTGEPNDSASRTWNSSVVSVKVQGSCEVVLRWRCQQTVHPCSADALTRQRLSHLTQKNTNRPFQVTPPCGRSEEGERTFTQFTATIMAACAELRSKKTHVH